MKSTRMAIHKDHQLSKSTLEIVVINFISYLIFLLIAGFIMWAQISHHAFIAGTDSSFHMNRFYEAAMQMKTGHFSYFQSLFAFHRTGRIVIAFYGPLMAYLFGGLLLICKNWVNFQIVNSLIVLSLSGWLMYVLCVKNRVKRWAALVIGTMYMTCYPVSIWPTAQKFTGLGAAFLPLAIICGMRMLKLHQIRVLPLALIMTLLVQTHLMSSVVAAMALVPMFIVGWLHATDRGVMFTNGFKAAGLTILLSGNVWGSIVDMFTTNHIIPVFPQQDIMTGTVHFYNWHLTYFGIIMTIVALLVTLSLIFRWRTYDYRWKTITFTAWFFLWLSSPWFPWNWVHSNWTPVTNVIQFPRRFLIVAIVLFLLAFGQSCSRRTAVSGWSYKGLKLRDVKYVVLLLFLIGSVGSLRHVITNEVNNYESSQVLNESRNMLHVDRQLSPDRLRKVFTSGDLGLAIRDVTKSTPDYLPSSRSLRTNRDYYRLHPYHMENVQLDSARPGFRHQIIGRDRLRLSWRNSRRAPVTVVLPITAYQQTRVVVNGHAIMHPRISSVGALKVRPRVGLNHATIEFHPDFSLGLMMTITVLTWIMLISYLVFNRRQI